MANIKNELNNIKSAIYGKDVRSSIHNGIDAINKEVESTTGRQVDLENTFDHLVINAGNSNAEIVDARVKNDGTSYSKLGDRLDGIDSQLAHIEEKNKVSVTDFGAIGNGVNDDTNAILSALKYVKDSKRGELFFPKGTYVLNTPIVTDTSNITIKGEGKGVTKLINGSEFPSNNFLITLGNLQSYSINYATWKNRIENISISNSSGGGVRLRNTHQYSVINCEILKCVGNGLDVDFSWVGNISESVFYLNLDGVHMGTNSAHAVDIRGCHFIGNIENGLYAPSMSSVNGCTFENNAKHDIYIYGKTSCYLSGNYFEGGRTTTSGTCICVENSNCITLSSNGLSAQPKGIDVINSHNIIINNAFQGLNSYVTTVYNNYRNIYIDKKCYNVQINNCYEPIYIEDLKNPTIKVLQRDIIKTTNLLDKLQLDDSNNLISWTSFINLPLSEKVESISGLTDYSIKVTSNVANSYFYKLLTNLKPNTVYTLGCLISWQGLEDCCQFRVTGTPQENNIGDEPYYIQGYNMNMPIRFAIPFTSTENGVASLRFGTPDSRGSFIIDSLCLIEGNFNSHNFPNV